MDHDPSTSLQGVVHCGGWAARLSSGTRAKPYSSVYYMNLTFGSVFLRYFFRPLLEDFARPPGKPTLPQDVNPQDETPLVPGL